MIKSLKYTDPDLKGVPGIPWAKDVKLLRERREFTFAPTGVTVLWGGNGSGKSTVLDTLAHYFHARQGGLSKVTGHSFYELGKAALVLPDGRVGLGVEIEHDGQPICHYHGGQRAGAVGSSFDDDFMDIRSMRTLLGRGSHGQTVMMGLVRVLDMVDGKEPWPEWAKAHLIGDPISPPKGAERGQCPTPKDLLAPTIPVSDPPVRTVLLDEPEQGLGFRYQHALWRRYFTMGMQGDGKRAFDPARYQFIIATHSPWALGIPGITYIDLDGSLQANRDAYIMLGKLLEASGGPNAVHG